MAQTTGQMSFCEAKVYKSTDCSTWTDEISGESVAIAVSGGERMSGTSYTFEGDTALLASGKRQPLTVTLRIIYAESDTASWYETLAQYATACGGTYCLRWAPQGGDSGEYVFTTVSTGVLKSISYPQGDVTSADVVTAEIVVETPSITQTKTA